MAYHHMRRSVVSIDRSDSRKPLGKRGIIRGHLRLKSAIHEAGLTIHEADVRNCPYFSDKLVEDWRWQKR